MDIDQFFGVIFGISIIVLFVLLCVGIVIFAIKYIVGFTFTILLISGLSYLGMKMTE